MLTWYRVLFQQKFVILPDLIIIFVWTAAVATINFSLAGVWLLIKSGCYSSVTLITFGPIPQGAVHKNGEYIRLVCEGYTSNNQDIINEEAATLPRNQTKAVCCHGFAWMNACNHDHPHLIKTAHACSYYSRVATTIKQYFYAREIYEICQNGPFDKFMRFLFMHSIALCMAH